jgi:hypothetical protein
MPTATRDLSNLHISESFYRLLQVDPTDDRTVLDGTGSIVTTLTVSGTLETFNIETAGIGLFNGINVFTGSLIIPTGSSIQSSQQVGSLMTSGSDVYIYL